MCKQKNLGRKEFLTFIIFSELVVLYQYNTSRLCESHSKIRKTI